MTHTHYTTGNVVLLVVGVAICCFNSFFTAMTFGFGDITQTGVQRIAIVIAQWCIVLAVPAFLVAIRWCHVALFALWCLTLSCALFGLIGGLINVFFSPSCSWSLRQQLPHPSIRIAQRQYCHPERTGPGLRIVFVFGGSVFNFGLSWAAEAKSHIF
jgi:hypothetical protein